MEDAYLIRYYINKDNTLNIEKIVNDYSNYIFAIIKNITKNFVTDEDIEEMISDVLFVIWKNRQNLNYDFPLKPYIAGISKNIAKNKLKSLNISYESIETQEEVISKENVEEFRNENKIQENQKSNMFLKVASFIIVAGIVSGNIYTYATYKQDIFSYVLDKLELLDSMPVNDIQTDEKSKFNIGELWI